MSVSWLWHVIPVWVRYVKFIDARCGSGVPGVAATPSGSDGGKGRELSVQTSEFLLTLTGEADTVARQLAACQDVIRSDRK
tara:strand:- start:192 stop:434 length:243 start_codon:yes stop_codon:yes gene_type:complete